MIERSSTMANKEQYFFGKAVAFAQNGVLETVKKSL